MKSRTKARSIALQVLYEYDITNHLHTLIFNQRIENCGLQDNLLEFARQIISGVIPIIEQLDKLIAIHAPEWPLDQVASIDRNIIRIALWEFAVAKCTPIKVAINEAVELAKVYGSDSTPRFVNGVLGSLSDQSEKIHNLIKSV